MDQFYVVNEVVSPGLSYPQTSEIRRHYFVSLENAKEKFYEVMKRYADSDSAMIDDPSELNWKDYFDECWEREECEDVVSWEVLYFEDKQLSENCTLV